MKGETIDRSAKGRTPTPLPLTTPCKETSVDPARSVVDLLSTAAPICFARNHVAVVRLRSQYILRDRIPIYLRAPGGRGDSAIRFSQGRKNQIGVYTYDLTEPSNIRR